MSNTMNMNPKNLLILAAIGLGAYWFLTKQAKAASGAVAATKAFNASPAKASTSVNAQPASVTVGGLVDTFNQLLRIGQPAAVVPDAVASSSADAIPVNPANSYNIGGFDPAAINGMF